MTFQEYRNVDLLLLSVVTLIFEVIATLASNKWFYAQPIALSITLLMVCMTMMRWGRYAGIVAVVGGIAYCFISAASPEQYLIYCIGNLGALLALFYIKKLGKEPIRMNRWSIGILTLIAYIGMAFGRWLVSLIFGGNLITFVGFLTTDVISLLFAAVVLCLISKQEGMLEDQKAYLLRLDRERQDEHDNEDNDIIL